MLYEILISGFALATAGWLVTGIFCGFEIREVLRRQHEVALRLAGMKREGKLLRIW